MKKIHLTIVIALFSIITFAQAPNWAWAKTSIQASITTSIAVDNAVDANGNIYVVGAFNWGSVQFGSTTLYNTHNGNVANNVFLVKYDASGNVLWAKSVSGSESGGWYGNTYPTSIAVDAAGNIYITGYSSTADTLFFGSITLVPSYNQVDKLFIAKYDTNGNVIWAKSEEGSRVYALGIALDPAGNSYITGSFKAAIVKFGSTTLTNSDNTGNSIDMFIVKYNASGNVVWAKSTGGVTKDDIGSDIGVDANGNSYVTGYFSCSSITFGSYTLTRAGSSLNDFYIVKYDTGGNVIWAKSLANAFGQKITTDAAGNSYLSGRFYGSSIVFGNDTLVNSGSADIFTAKYDANGNAIWAKSAVGFGSGYFNVGGIVNDQAGNIYITGSFYCRTIVFGSTTIHNADTTNNHYDMFIAKYSAGGNIVWAKSTGKVFYDESAQGMALDASGNIYIAGNSSGYFISFDSITLSLSGHGNMLIAKLFSTPPYCFANYTTTYDSISNNFTLTIDNATAAMAVAYHWDFGDGTTSSLPNPSHAYAVDTTYNVCMKIYTATTDSCQYCHIIGKDWQGNIYRTTGFTVNVNNPNTTVDVLALQNHQPSISFYPNPFNSQTTIKFSEIQTNTTIKILDVLGNEIKSIKFTGIQLSIDKAEMKAGIYFVQTIDEQKNINNRKIIIQ